MTDNWPFELLLEELRRKITIAGQIPRWHHIIDRGERNLPDLVITDIPEPTLKAMRELAAAKGLSAEDYAIELLREALCEVRLRNVLIEDEDSGEPRSFDKEAFRNTMLRQKNLDTK